MSPRAVNMVPKELEGELDPEEPAALGRDPDAENQ